MSVHNVLKYMQHLRNERGKRGFAMRRSCNFEALNTSQEMVVVSHGNDIASAAHRSDLPVLTRAFLQTCGVIVCDTANMLV